MTNEMLTAIDEVVLESEYEVISSLLDSYDKAYTIVQEYKGDDIENFSIIQEADKVSGPYDNFRKDDPELKLRKEKGNGKKENIVFSIIAALPRLISFCIDLIKKKIRDRQVDKANAKWKNMTKFVNEAMKDCVFEDEDTGETVNLGDEFIQTNLFGKSKDEKFVTQSTATTVRVVEKAPFLIRLRNWMIKKSLKVIVIGGTVYTLKKTGIAKRKYDEAKDAAIKKIDEIVIAPIKKASDAAAAKITAAADACKQAMAKAIEFIKKIFNAVKKFVNLKFLGYDQTGEEGIICRINIKDGSLDCTFSVDYWTSWVDNATNFVDAAAKYIGTKFNDKLQPEKNESGKREGVLADADKPDTSESFVVWCGRQIFNIHSSAVSATEVMEKMLSKTAKKAEKKNNYKPIDKFFKDTAKLGDDLDKLNKACSNLVDRYKHRVEDNPSENNKRIDSEKVILETLRNILDTQVHVVNAIGAISDYINEAADAVDAYAIDETPSSSTKKDEKDKDE